MEVTLTAVAVVAHPLKSGPYLPEPEGRHRSANGPRIDSDMVFLFETRRNGQWTWVTFATPPRTIRASSILHSWQGFKKLPLSFIFNPLDAFKYTSSCKLPGGCICAINILGSHPHIHTNCFFHRLYPRPRLPPPVL